MIKYLIRYHKTLRHGSREVCRKCLNEMRSPEERRNHRLQHAEMVFVCEPCNRMFASENEVEKHENSKVHKTLTAAYNRGAKILHRISMGAETPSRKIPQTPGGQPLGNVSHRFLTPQLQKILRKHGNSVARSPLNNNIQLQKSIEPELVRIYVNLKPVLLVFFFIRANGPSQILALLGY